MTPPVGTHCSSGTSCCTSGVTWMAQAGHVLSMRLAVLMVSPGMAVRVGTRYPYQRQGLETVSRTPPTPARATWLHGIVSSRQARRALMHAPKRQKRGILVPTTPLVAGPEWMPTRTCG